MNNQGTLYIVATPIGNIADLSARAKKVLQTVDKIAAEDTRHSKLFLQKLGIDTPLVSYHDYSSSEAAQAIIKELQNGLSIALISDAGTPLISDPGYKLVRLARESALEVLPVPGASSVTAALSVSGLPTDRFLFTGFLPVKSGARRKFFIELKGEERTCVFFESPHRIVDCLNDMSAIIPSSREVFIAREMSKKFETHYLGSAEKCFRWINADTYQQKGEFVIVVAGCDDSELEESKQELAMKIVNRLGEKISMKDAVNIATEISGARRNLLYERVLAKKSEYV